jgi:hypothetical protein
LYELAREDSTAKEEARGEAKKGTKQQQQPQYDNEPFWAAAATWAAMR